MSTQYGLLPLVLLVVSLLTWPIWIRLSNEVTGRLLGRVVIVCPHCGVPGVARSTNPRVFR